MTASVPSKHPGVAPVRAAALSERQLLAGILLIVALMSLPTLRFGFVYDDQWVLVANGFLRHPEDLWHLLTPLAREQGVPDAFRPSSVLFDVASYSLLGLRAGPHHLLSVGLHLSCCFALYLLVRRLGADATLALGSCLVFGLLGVHAEAVAVVSFREDLIAASAGLFACVLAIPPHSVIGDPAQDSPREDDEAFARRPFAAANSGETTSRSSEHPRRAALACATLLATIACTAKESAWPLPFVFAALLILDPWPLRTAKGATPTPRSILLRCTPMAIGLGLAITHRLATIGALAPWAQATISHVFTHGDAAARGIDTTMPPPSTGDLAALGPLSRGVTALAWSLGQVWVPIGLSPEYPERPLWLRVATLLVAAILLLWSALRLLRRGRRDKAKRTTGDANRDGAAMAVLLTAMMMVPVCGLIELPNAQADRQAYFWTAPLSVAIAALLINVGARWATTQRVGAPELVTPSAAIDGEERRSVRAGERDGSRWAMLLAFAGWQGASFVGATHSYASDAAIWARASKVAPDRPRVQAMLGLQDLAAARSRLRDEPELGARVRVRCEAARDRDPGHELPHICLAQLALALDDFRTAERESLTALTVARAREDRLLGDWLDARSRHPAAVEGRERTEILGEIAAAAARFPYSSDLAASSARVAHRVGEPELALERVRSARSLRPERWQTVALGLEIALDTGDAPNVAHTFWVDRHFLDAADPATRTMLARRFQHLMRSHPTPLIDAFFAPGVFPDESP